MSCFQLSFKLGKDKSKDKEKSSKYASMPPNARLPSTSEESNGSAGFTGPPVHEIINKMSDAEVNEKFEKMLVRSCCCVSL